MPLLPTSSTSSQRPQKRTRPNSRNFPTEPPKRQNVNRQTTQDPQLLKLISFGIIYPNQINIPIFLYEKNNAINNYGNELSQTINALLANEDASSIDYQFVYNLICSISIALEILQHFQLSGRHLIKNISNYLMHCSNKAKTTILQHQRHPPKSKSYSYLSSLIIATYINSVEALKRKSQPQLNTIEFAINTLIDTPNTFFLTILNDLVRQCTNTNTPPTHNHNQSGQILTNTTHSPTSTDETEASSKPVNVTTLIGPGR